MEYIKDFEKKGKKKKFSKVILLSKSPRRKELLNFLNPEIMPVDIDERKIQDKYMKIYHNDSFLERAIKISCQISKAKADVKLEENCLYIASDTMVINDAKIYNKPIDKSEAKKMLKSYFGKKHYVITSVVLKMTDYIEVFYSLAKVEFVQYYKKLEEVIDDYVNSSLAMDKAGAYGIQEIDKRLIKSIEGDINTIIGMPVAETAFRIFN